MMNKDIEKVTGKQVEFTKNGTVKVFGSIAKARKMLGISEPTIKRFSDSGKEIKGGGYVKVLEPKHPNIKEQTSEEKLTEHLEDVRKEVEKPKPSKKCNTITEESVQESPVVEICTFWNTYYNEKKGKYMISFHAIKYGEWLSENGIYKIIVAPGKYQVIKMTDNVVSIYYEYDLRAFVKKHIDNLPYEFDEINKSQLQQWFFDNRKDIITSHFEQLLITKEIEFFRDSKDKATIFFQNTIVEIAKGGLSLKGYKDFNKPIWKDQILKRDFEIKDFENGGMFEQFITNIFTDRSNDSNKVNVHNVKSFYTAIGYLIHSYKDESFLPAIVFNDKQISDNPNGRTGKGIVFKAIGQLKNMIKIDGKKLDFTKQFVFQRVELSHDFLVFDDVKKNFDFEELFSVISEGITVEKKNKGEFYISFEDSPKILITTNYAVKGEGNSIEGRKVDYELEQYYYPGFTPFNEFGKMFFSGWNKKGVVTI